MWKYRTPPGVYGISSRSIVIVKARFQTILSFNDLTKFEDIFEQAKNKIFFNVINTREVGAGKPIKQYKKQSWHKNVDRQLEIGKMHSY